MSQPPGKNQYKQLVSMLGDAALARIVEAVNRTMGQPLEKNQYKQLLSLLGKVAVKRVTKEIDRTVGWDKLPVPLGLGTLLEIRKRLRERNLYDIESPATRNRRPRPEWVPRYQTARTADGTYNELEDPQMGSAGTRFGRNTPTFGRTFPASEQGTIMEPNPLEISSKLLTRKTFQPVRGLNLLAAAWIQFMIRDWFSHGRGSKEDPWELPGNEHWPEGMQIPRIPEDHSSTQTKKGLPPAYVNKVTHWWDGSQIYGSDKATQYRVRSNRHGKLKVDSNYLPDFEVPADPESEKPAVEEPGFWLGLAMMQALFALEHNAICDRLCEEYPEWSDDKLFDHARLINIALLAKIHTVEWTPAILGHPTVQISLRSNWWGLAGEQIHELFGRISDNEVISGIPGSPKDHFGVPYAMTEEFVAVYRMHPLIPDKYSFWSAKDSKVLQDESGRELQELGFTRLEGRKALDLIYKDKVPMKDLFYSFGIAHPGEITLHNYPRSLQEFRRPDGKVMDLAATDILRNREFGLPRYNEFRELLHRPPVRTFEELTDNPAWAEELRRVYKDNIDLVDLMIGLYAEPKPEGFGFSDTAFRIFILMASRRLNSDRFFTTDYTPEVYTPVGLEWVDDNDMRTVLLRHFPDLSPWLHNIKNAFFPWEP